MKCSQPKEDAYIRAILRVQAGVDVVSDGFGNSDIKDPPLCQSVTILYSIVTLIPITLLWGAHINLRTNMELLAIPFSPWSRQYSRLFYRSRDRGRMTLGCSHGVHSKLLYVCRTIPSNFYPSPRSSPMLHHMIDSHACTAIIIACLVSYRASIKNKTPRKRSTPVAQVPIL